MPSGQDDEIAGALQELNQNDDMRSDDDDDGPNKKSSGRQKPFVDKPGFNLFMTAIIITNGICIGIEADDQKYNSLQGKTGIEDRLTWYVLENIFLLLFLFEISARMFYAKSFLAFAKSGQNQLDFVLVAMNVADTWVIQITSNGASNLRILTVLRIVRILRLVRIIKVLKAFRQLTMLVLGLSHAMRTLFWIALVLFIFLYTSAIWCTLLIGQDDESYNTYFREKQWDHEVYFGNIWKSMFTLFQVCTLDRWAEDVVRHVAQVQPTMIWFFLAFVLFATYGLLNLVVGIIVESTLSTSKFNSERVIRKKANDRKTALMHIKNAFESMDDDASGTLSLNELKSALENPEISTRLKMIDFPIDDPEKIFMLLDVDQKGELDIDSFIKGCMRLSGQAASKDIIELLVWVDNLGKQLTTLEDKILIIQEKTSQLDRKTEKMSEQAVDMFSDPKRVRKRMEVE